jgi:hypothetical protein
MPRYLKADTCERGVPCTKKGGGDNLGLLLLVISILQLLAGCRESNELLIHVTTAVTSLCSMLKSMTERMGRYRAMSSAKREIGNKLKRHYL